MVKLKLVGQNKKYFKNGYIHGFMEALRLAHGFPKHSTVGHMIKRRKFWALIALRDQWKNSMQLRTLERRSPAKRKRIAEADRRFDRARGTGEPPNEKFIPE